jgi:hypothetical protein
MKDDIHILNEALAKRYVAEISLKKFTRDMR